MQTTHHPDINGLPVTEPSVKGAASVRDSIAFGTCTGQQEDADSVLRAGNGLRDSVVFPRLRAMGIPDTDLHTTAMRLVRKVQSGRDVDGSIAALLGVVRYGINGTVALPEVV